MMLVAEYLPGLNAPPFEDFPVQACMDSTPVIGSNDMDGMGFLDEHQDGHSCFTHEASSINVSKLRCSSSQGLCCVAVR